MPPAKRSDFQREADYLRISELYLRGWKQAEIAADLSLSQGMISQDLKVIRERWRKETMLNLDEAKTKELAKIDRLEREFWAAWEKSQGERTKARQETSDGGKKGKSKVTKASMEKEQRDGNPAFLQGVLTCIDRRCKLLGLDAPEKKEFLGKDGGPILVTVDR